MVMEAMRLSLLEHEEQQRREREEEAKKQRQAAEEAAQGEETHNHTTGSGSPSATLSNTSSAAPDNSLDRTSSRPSEISVVYTSPTSPSDTSQPIELSTGSDNGRSRPRTPADQDAPLTQQSAQVDNQSGPSEDTENPLQTALRGVPSTPSVVVAQLIEEDERRDGSGETSHSSSQPPTPEITVNQCDVGHADVANQDHQAVTSPVPIRPDSATSSLAPAVEPDAYDMLSSSPDSTISHKPLLESSTSSMPVLALDADSSASHTA